MPAFEAVLADIRRRGVEQIYCLGDLVGKGPESATVVDLCREGCQGTVQGNWDANMTLPTDKKTRLWHQHKLGSSRLDYLRSLPGVIDFQMSGKWIRLFHASPQGIDSRVYCWDKHEILRSMFKNTDFTGFKNPVPDLVLYGDIHQAYMLPLDGKLLINVGSVGNPMDYITLAGYVILTGHFASGRRSDIGVEFVRLPYPIEKAVAIARSVGMPKLAEYAFELRTANHRNHLPKGYKA